MDPPSDHPNTEDLDPYSFSNYWRNIHEKNAISEMLFTYEKISSQLNREIFLCPADYPYLYSEIGNSKVFFGNMRHWRTVNESLITFLTSKKMITKYLNELKLMDRDENTLYDDKIHNIKNIIYRNNSFKKHRSRVPVAFCSRRRVSPIAFSGESIIYDEVATIIGIIPLEIFFDYSNALSGKDYPKMFQILSKIRSSSFQLDDLIDGLNLHFRNYILALTPDGDTLMNLNESHKKEYVDTMISWDLNDILQIINQLLNRLSLPPLGLKTYGSYQLIAKMPWPRESLAEK